ncbi:MAG: tyrosine-type recombinase/integrase [Chloroflexota bacterium]|nr:tyrosine-type recombinase/integrase [Chloroflexota bacterium]
MHDRPRHHYPSPRWFCPVVDGDTNGLRGYSERLRGWGLAQASVATKVRSLKAFGRSLAAEEYVARDPFARMRRTRVDDAPVVTLTPGEVDRLLVACDRRRPTGARDFAIMLLLFSTGLRAGEVLGLRADDLDPDKGLIVVRRGKGGRFRVVPLGRAVEKALYRYLDHPGRRALGDGSRVFLTDEGTPLTMRGLQVMLRRRGQAAGIHANPHKWRHSAAVQYLRGGGRIEALKALLGHSTLDMTLHYARIAGVDLAAAHATADPARSLKVRG